MRGKHKNNNLVYIITAFIGIVAYLIYRYKHSHKIKDGSQSGSQENSKDGSQSGSQENSKDGSQSGSQENSKDGSQNIKDGYGNIMNTNLVYFALQGYKDYCDSKGYKFNFKITNETAKNIYVHYLIETGSGKYLYDNNTHNLTAGNWKTDPHKASPYISDYIGHKYLGLHLRGDRGEKDGKQEFRCYDCFICSLFDYLDLINRAKRYAGIAPLYDNKDPIFIRELGLAGYYSANPETMYKTAKKLKESL
jgi:flagellum-specific peptidoglycan hydrolase FlgJ